MKKSFTLLEILLALFFLGTCLISILSIMSLNIRLSEHLNLKRQAIDLASSRLEVETYNGPLININSDTFLITTEEDNPSPGISKTLTVKVSWNDNFYPDSQITLAKTYYKGID